MSFSSDGNGMLPPKGSLAIPEEMRLEGNGCRELFREGGFTSGHGTIS
jgi:hypothetical protein